MDTPNIAEYYRENDPLKRKAILQKSIEAGEEPENNAIREELWNVRYSGTTSTGTPADNFLRLWMTLEFNRDAGNRFFGQKKAKKEIMKDLNSLKFAEYESKSEAYQGLLYRECVHLLRLYMTLCQTDKSYNTYLMGIVTMKKESAEDKLRSDIYKAAVLLPKELGMEKELGILSKAARQAYSEHFSGETLPEA